MDELRTLQLERLRGTLARAHRDVAPYRRKLESAGVHPDELRELSDLARFPFTTKQDLRDAYPFGMFAVPREQLARIHASSGTTGQPTVVGYTRGDLDRWADLIARSLHAAGARPGDLLHNAYGYGLFTGGLGFHAGAERLGCTCVPLSGGMTSRQVRLIRDFEPDIIAVTPSYLLAIADEFERQGHDPRDSSLRIGVLGAEPWSESIRTEIEERFAIDAINHYGLSEVMGPGVASECAETRDGLTLWEDHFLPEIVDPVTGALLPDGELGELVLTTLTKEALPLVRYRTRDLTRLLPPTRGSMRRLARIGGRSDDMLIIRGVNLFPTQIEELVLEDERLSPHYELELRKSGHLDQLTVVVEARPALSRAGEPAMQHAARALESAIKARIGLSAKARVTGPGGVERSEGKARRVRDLRE